MSFALKVRGDVTPRQLVALHQSGHAVYRTAHIGNQYLSNLLLVSLGLPLYLYDKTTLSRDINYHPAVKIRNGAYEKLAAPTDTLVPYATCSPEKTERAPSLFNVEALPGYSAGSVVRKDTPASIHYQALKKLFGDLVFTEAELFLRYEEKIAEIFSIIERHDPTRFNRYTFPCGCMVGLSQAVPGLCHARCPHQEKDISRENMAHEAMQLLYSLRDLVLHPETAVRSGGVVPSLALTQIICSLVGWWESGKPEVYELSGPDFIKYGPNPEFIRELKSIFSEIQKYGGPSLELPSHLYMELVPTADFRFGYIQGDPISSLMLWLYRTAMEMQQEKKKVLARLSEKEKHMAISRTAEFGGVKNVLAQALKESKGTWDIFYDIHQQMFFSQHDLLPDKRLVIPEQFLDMPFGEMKAFLHRIQQIEKSLLS